MSRAGASIRRAVNKAAQKAAEKEPGPLLGRLFQVYGILGLGYYLIKTGSFRFIRLFPPGHFHSPIPDLKDVRARSRNLFDRDVDELPGVDLREEEQLTLLKSFARYYDELPFPEEPGGVGRYYYENRYFSYGDVISLYSMMRHYRPCRVIEVGSGFSSAAMLDVDDLFLDKKTRFTFIEPHPERLLGLLGREGEERHDILRQPVQEVPLELFETLSAADILFVDSSHVVKVGSDVAYLLFQILPRLAPGVIIHFHDIFWPFEYPKEWLTGGAAFNEAYFLRAFLQFNGGFEVLYFGSFLAERHADALREQMPLCLKRPHYSVTDHEASYTSSLWIRRKPATRS